MGAIVVIVTLGFALAQLALIAHAALQVRLIWAARRPPRACAPAAPDEALPTVTVQLPIFNEGPLGPALLARIAAFDYPRDRLEVQVLDDSTDGTSAQLAIDVADWQARGGRVVLLRRSTRTGFKAGALAAGLRRAHGELIAIFDADFAPEPQFLRRVVARFVDPRVAVVQARWGHGNRDESLLTRMQALFLDVHFRIEQRARDTLGCFVTFNGTAGVWRRAAIDDAGGWSSATLTEDVDLAYRAQLRGWRVRYDDEVAVAAELPASMAGFRSQQARWMRGLAENARRLLPDLVRARMPWPVKLHACAHLLQSCLYPLVLVQVILAVPLAWWVEHGQVPVWVRYNPLGLLAFALLVPVYYLPQRAAGLGVGRFAIAYGFFMLMSAGMAVANALAVAASLRRRPGAFVRTPKRAAGVAIVVRLDHRIVVEALVAVALAVAVVHASPRGFVPLLWLPALTVIGIVVGWGLLSADVVAQRRIGRRVAVTQGGRR